MIILAGLFLLGVLSSLMGSLTGLGGGFVIVPLLNLFFGFEMKNAIFFSLTAILFLSSYHGIKNRHFLRSYRHILRSLIVFSILGAAIAAYFGTQIPSRTLSLLFSVVMIGFSTYYAVDKSHDFSVPPLGTSPGWAKALIFLSGALGGLLGLGGGVVNVPIFNKVLRFPMKDAVQMSLAMVFVSSSTALVIYLNRRRDALEDLSMTTLAALVIGTLAGAVLSRRIRLSHDSTRRLFCVLLALLGLYKLSKSLNFF